MNTTSAVIISSADCLVSNMMSDKVIGKALMNLILNMGLFNADKTVKVASE